MSRLVTNAIRSTAASSDAMTIDSAGKPSFPNGGVGKILQFKQTVKTDVFSTSINEGTVSGDVTGLTVSITPSSATNKIYLDVRAYGGVDGSSVLYGYFYKNGSVQHKISTNFNSNDIKAYQATLSTTFDLSAGDYVQVYARISDSSGSPRICLLYTSDAADEP